MLSKSYSQRPFENSAAQSLASEERLLKAIFYSKRHGLVSQQVVDGVTEAVVDAYSCPKPLTEDLEDIIAIFIGQASLMESNWPELQPEAITFLRSVMQASQERKDKEGRAHPERGAHSEEQPAQTQPESALTRKQKMWKMLHNYIMLIQYICIVGYTVAHIIDKIYATTGDYRKGKGKSLNLTEAFAALPTQVKISCLTVPLAIAFVECVVVYLFNEVKSRKMKDVQAENESLTARGADFETTIATQALELQQLREQQRAPAADP